MFFTSENNRSIYVTWRDFMAKEIKQTKEKGTKTKKISVQLLMVLVPMIAAFIIIVAVIIFTNSKSIIIDQSMSG